MYVYLLITFEKINFSLYCIFTYLYYICNAEPTNHLLYFSFQARFTFTYFLKIVFPCSPPGVSRSVVSDSVFCPVRVLQRVCPKTTGHTQK